ncbi:MAG: STAS domain-containing protein [Candidatus Brocadiia bacterium]
MRTQKTKILADVTGEQAVIYFVGSTVRDLGDVQKIVDEIEEVAYNSKITLLVINFSRLTQLTSAFLGRLITLNKSLKQTGVTLRLCSMSPQIEEAFRICKFQKLIPLFPTEEKALAG